MHDPGVGHEVRVESAERHREQRGPAAVTRPRREEHQQEERGEDAEEGRPRAAMIGSASTVFAKKNSGPKVVNGFPIGTRDGGGRSGSVDSARPESTFISGGCSMLTIAERRGDREVARQDVDRLVGRERVLPRVVVDEDEGERASAASAAAQRDRRPQDRRPARNVCRARADRAEKPSLRRIFLPSACERPK